MRPGMIWLTRILSAASSSASVFDSADTDARRTVDSPRFGIGSFTDADVDIRIEPPPRAFIDGTAARTIRSALNSSRSTAFCHAASSNDTAGAGRRAAAVGEQQIDAAEALDGLLRPGGDLIAVPDVHRHAEDGRAAGREPLRRPRRSTPGVRGRHRDDRAFARQRFRDREAEPAARAARPSRPCPSDRDPFHAFLCRDPRQHAIERLPASARRARPPGARVAALASAPRRRSTSLRIAMPIPSWNSNRISGTAR